jgi:hypothetical protein
LDRETWKWLGVFALTFVVSVVGGWFLPDGLNEVAELTHQAKVPTTALVRFFSLALLFSTLATIDLIVWSRSQARKAAANIDGAIRGGLASYGAEVAESAVLQSLLPYKAATKEQASYGAGIIKLLGDVLAAVPHELLPGYSVYIEDCMSRVGDQVRTLGNSRVGVNIEQHLAINRRMAHSEKGYTHLNRRVFNAPNDWTEDWRNMVAEFGAAAFTPEYIVVMEKASLERHADKVRSMYAFLGTHAWLFRCCELEQVLDTIGEELPTDANVDVFGASAAKLHWIPAAGYRGAATIDIRLVRLLSEPALQSYINTVRRFAWTPDKATGMRP